MYAELMNNARMLMDVNDQLILNEETKLALLEEIDLKTVEVIRKRQVVLQLQHDLNHLKTEYKSLKQEINNLDDRAEFLKNKVKECEDEYEQTMELMSIKKLEIE